MASRKLVTVIIAALIVISWCYPQEAKAEEPAQKNYALILGGISHHQSKVSTKSHQRFNENNASIGIRAWDDGTLLGGRPYLEANYIEKNSMRGKTITAGAGIEWTLIETRVVDVCGGLQVFYMNYENPKKNKTYGGFTGVPYLCLKKDDISLNLVFLGSKILFLNMAVSF